MRLKKKSVMYSSSHKRLVEKLELKLNFFLVQPFLPHGEVGRKKVLTAFQSTAMEIRNRLFSHFVLPVHFSVNRTLSLLFSFFMT